MGSTTLFKAVFINPEQVVRFYACMERLLAGACNELIMLDIDLSTVSIYYDLRYFNIQISEQNDCQE